MSPLRVFVVDPNEQRAAWLVDLVAAQGHEVEHFTHGERAIDRFVQRPADALLVEYVLPGRDGVATVEAIRWAPGGRDVRVILLAREEPVTAPLQMLALRVDATVALVGEPDEQRVLEALHQLERRWDDDGTLALGDDSYARHLEEARRRSTEVREPLPRSKSPHHEWLEVATVIAGAVRVETVEAGPGGEEPTIRGDAADARAIGLGPSPKMPGAPGLGGADVPERPRATFDDVTVTEPGLNTHAAATVSMRSLDASDARAILGLSPGQILGRPVSRPRFAAPAPTSTYRAPPSTPAPALVSAPRASVAVAPAPIEAPVEPTPIEAPIEPTPIDPAPFEAAPIARSPRHAEEPIAPAPSAVRRAEMSTRQITMPRDPSPAPFAVPTDPHTLDEGRFVSARAKEAERNDWSGSFAATPFPALLRRIADDKANGGLVCTAPATRPGDPRVARATVDGAPTTKVVFFRGGVPVQVRSNVLDECLGQLLLRKKRLSVAALEESVRRMRERGDRQGQVLLEMRVLSSIELGELLSEQVRQKLFDLFGWRRGEFRFAADMEAPRDGVALEMALPDMVYEGVCAAMPATLLLDIMTPRLEHFVVPDPVRMARFGRVRVSADLRSILEQIDGATPLRDVLRAGARPGAIAQLLYALECLGAITLEARANVRRVQLPPLSLEQPIERPRVEDIADDPAWDDVTNERPRRLRDDASGPQALAPVPDAPNSFVPSSFAPSAFAAGPSAAPSSRSDELEGPLGADVSARRAVGGPALDAHVDRMFEAERCFRRGNRSLARSEHREALAAFERAVELCPDEGEFVAYLGWARYCVDPSDADGARVALRELVRATTLAPDLHLTHLLHARVLDHAGHTLAAIETYRAVLALEPSMDEAAQALGRLLQQQAR